MGWPSKIHMPYPLAQKYKLLYLIEVKTWPTKLPQRVRFQICTCRVSISQKASNFKNKSLVQKISYQFFFLFLYLCISSKKYQPHCSAFCKNVRPFCSSKWMSKYKVCEVYVVSLLLCFLYVLGVVSNSESAAQSMGEADVRCRTPQWREKCFHSVSP